MKGSGLSGPFLFIRHKFLASWKLIQPKGFSDRVDNYIKYRPTYPNEVLDYLKKKCHLTHQTVIADVGAGTGIFTKLLLGKGYIVYAVEPNTAMRDAAVAQLSANKNFTPVDGTAGVTTLPSNSNRPRCLCAGFSLVQ